MERQKEKKSKFNKKVMAFGILGVFALAFATAMVVNYLSNTATANVEVQSPYHNELSVDGSTWADTVSISAFPHVPFPIYTRTTSLTSVDGNVTYEIAINNANNDVTCADFEHIEVSYDGGLTWADITPTWTNVCVDNNGSSSITETPINLTAGSQYQVAYNWTFAPVNPQQYTWDVVVRPI